MYNIIICNKKTRDYRLLENTSLYFKEGFCILNLDFVVKNIIVKPEIKTIIDHIDVKGCDGSKLSTIDYLLLCLYSDTN